MIKPAKHICAACLGLWLVLLLVPASAAACSPPPPVPWSLESITIDTSALPPGVTLRKLDATTLALSNRTPVDLYLIGRQTRPGASPPPLPIPLPSGTATLARLVDGRIFTWRGTGQSAALQWQEATGAGEGLPIVIEDQALRTDAGVLAEVVAHNPLADNRPATIQVPPPQSTEILVVYDDQLRTIPLTISYRLRQAYDPHAFARARAACDRTWIAVLGASVPVIIVAVVLGGLYRLVSRRQS